MLSSVLLVLDARRNLIRLAREGTLSAQRYDICRGRVPIAAFLTRDAVQQQAARELGLPVLASDR